MLKELLALLARSALQAAIDLPLVVATGVVAAWAHGRRSRPAATHASPRPGTQVLRAVRASGGVRLVMSPGLEAAFHSAPAC